MIIINNDTHGHKLDLRKGGNKKEKKERGREGERLNNWNSPNTVGPASITAGVKIRFCASSLIFGIWIWPSNSSSLQEHSPSSLSSLRRLHLGFGF